jgi:hypothetical protein
MGIRRLSIWLKHGLMFVIVNRPRSVLFLPNALGAMKS